MVTNKQKAFESRFYKLVGADSHTPKDELKKKYRQALKNNHSDTKKGNIEDFLFLNTEECKKFLNRKPASKEQAPAAEAQAVDIHACVYKAAKARKAETAQQAKTQPKPQAVYPKSNRPSGSERLADRQIKEARICFGMAAAYTVGAGAMILSDIYNGTALSMQTAVLNPTIGIGATALFGTYLNALENKKHRNPARNFN